MSKFCFHNRKSTAVLAGVQGNVLYGLFWIQRQEAALTAFGSWVQVCIIRTRIASMRIRWIRCNGSVCTKHCHGGKGISTAFIGSTEKEEVRKRQIWWAWRVVRFTELDGCVIRLSEFCHNVCTFTLEEKGGNMEFLRYWSAGRNQLSGY